MNLTNEDDLLLAIAFNNVESSLLTELSKQICKGKVAYALNDLFEKAVAQQNRRRFAGPLDRKNCSSLPTGTERRNRLLRRFSRQRKCQTSFGR
jgi:hypothetical protein